MLTKNKLVLLDKSINTLIENILDTKPKRKEKYIHNH